MFNHPKNWKFSFYHNTTTCTTYKFEQVKILSNAHIVHVLMFQIYNWNLNCHHFNFVIKLSFDWQFDLNPWWAHWTTADAAGLIKCWVLFNPLEWCWSKTIQVFFIVEYTLNWSLNIWSNKIVFVSLTVFHIIFVTQFLCHTIYLFDYLSFPLKMSFYLLLFFIWYYSWSKHSLWRPIQCFFVVVVILSFHFKSF